MKRVLLVEDDPLNVAAFSAVVEASGRDVALLIAGEGQMALDLLAQHPDIVLVVMDVQMPGMGGLEATGKIRAMAEHKDLPIVALTANAMPGDEETCLAAGMSTYISKPVGRQGILDMLDTYVSPS